MEGTGPSTASMAPPGKTQAPAQGSFPGRRRTSSVSRPCRPSCKRMTVAAGVGMASEVLVSGFMSGLFVLTAALVGIP